VVVASSGAAATRIRSALEAGAVGMVLGSDHEFALLPAIVGAAAGLMVLPAAFKRQVARPMLTGREKQILALVVMGLSNFEIGQKLYLAESTVKSHLSTAFAKLGVRSRNAATAMILDPETVLAPGILRISESDRPLPSKFAAR
jgi:DNA-binding NarL/FixJ family response regulator